MQDNSALMNYVLAIFAGIAGTAIMTSYLYIVSWQAKEQMRVTKILGTMLTHQTTADKGVSHSTKALLTGVAVHYLVGIGIAVTYFLLWKYHVIEADHLGNFFLCVLSGMIGSIIWGLYYKFHTNPPVIPIKLYELHIFIAYVLFALATTHIFKFLYFYNLSRQ